jgi:hypothetical protein
MFKRLGLKLALLALLLAGCRMVSPPVGLSLGGSGNLATREYTVTGFSALEVQNAFQATVTQGENYKIAITADDNLLDVVVVEKVGERLVIRFDRNAEPVDQGHECLPVLQQNRRRLIEQPARTGVRG